MAFLAAGSFGRAISEYPPSDYRDLVAAAAATYGVETDEIMVGAGADEILDLVAKAFLPPGAAAVIPAPTYAMYRVLTEQRPAVPIAVPRLDADGGLRAGRPGDPEGRARRRDRVALLSQQPDRTARTRRSRRTPRRPGLRRGCTAAGDAALVVLDEAYAEFTGTSLLRLRRTYPRLVVVRTASKAYALAGMRVGFAIAARDVIARIEPFRPPGSVAIPSVALVAEALRRPDVLAANVARIARSSARVSKRRLPRPASRAPVGDQLPARPAGVPERARALATGLLRRGLVPRTFGADHPLAGHLRFTVRCRARTTALPRRWRTSCPPFRAPRPARRPPPPPGASPMTNALGNLQVLSRQGRRVSVVRRTRETDITLTLDLDGSGRADVATGIGFLDHLLTSLAHHGLLDLEVRASGDIHVDEHHTAEDSALVLGGALAEALGDRAGIARFGEASVPMDESIATAVVDVGGRPYAVIELPFRGERIGALPTQLVEHALESFARTSGTTLHVRGTGRNDHHLAEAAFKALARALRVAVAAIRGGPVPSPRPRARSGDRRAEQARWSPSWTMAPATSSPSSRRSPWPAPAS